MFPCKYGKTKYYILLSVLLHALPALAQQTQEPAANEEAQQERFTKLKAYSAEDKQSTCKKYSEKYISYYGNVYFVQNCKSHIITDHDEIYQLTKAKTKIEPVGHDVLAMLDEGEPYSNFVDKDQLRSCEQFNGRYVTFSYSDIFYVQNCQKRLFLDWLSFTTHRRSLPKDRRNIITLKWDEFEAIKTGDEMPLGNSTFYDDVMTTPELDVMPIKEACKGIEGKDMAYYDRIFKIENCKKREYDVIKYNRKFRNKMALLSKNILTSSQFLSLPFGEPIELD